MANDSMVTNLKVSNNKSKDRVIMVGYITQP